MLVGRSFKYHRPRGIVASGAEEPNALVNLGKGARFEPNQRATTTELFDGLRDQPEPLAQPRVRRGRDQLEAFRFLPAGFYYKMFIHPAPVLETCLRAVHPPVRRAGPRAQDRDPTLRAFLRLVDVLVIGGGVAGLQAARRRREAGAKVLLMEQTAHWGGRAPVDGGEIDGAACADWIVNETLAELRKMPNVTLRTRCMGAGVYDHGYVLAYER
jgi:sarcosine oxidase subunit alpha